MEYRHEGCTVCHCLSVISCALPPPTTSGEMGLLQTKFWTASTKKEKKKPLWTNSTYIWQLSILSINLSAILAAAEICVIHGYYVTSSVLHITGSEEMNLKSGWFKQNCTRSMALHLLWYVCLFFLFLQELFPSLLSFLSPFMSLSFWKTWANWQVIWTCTFSQVKEHPGRVKNLQTAD